MVNPYPANVENMASSLPMLINGGWDLTLILLTWTTWRAPTNASKWWMGFNSAFKGLTRGLQHEGAYRYCELD